MADKLKEAIIRGERTARWLEETEVQRVFDELTDDIAVLWSSTKSDQDDERERLYREMHGLRALRKRILQIIQDGKKAAIEVENSGSQRTPSGGRNQRSTQQRAH